MATTWRFVLTQATPAWVGEAMRELLLEEEMLTDERVSAESGAFWLRSKAYDLDLEQWEIAAGGWIAFCEESRMPDAEDARDFLTPFQQRWEESRMDLGLDREEPELPYEGDPDYAEWEDK